MELIVAITIGVLTAAGIYLILRLRAFPVILGLTLFTYATNLFVFATGRLAVGLPPVLNDEAAGYSDPLPQALVLTAIVISFGMTAVLVLISLGAYLEAGSDKVEYTTDDDDMMAKAEQDEKTEGAA
ncbi:Na+/H+ antiporter subunit C [Salipiger pallidus]|uniref:Na+/H+ antiporter subunit C n=1 Tax=Salipiger pallidus TaxID=1775170 RepID=A0A8J3EG42_9RHOB|nr:Na+/H+ antiporter subunit C [Salipiger pallidus]GGG68864.1 Na+/H+ antiporter subunit C [Salipiger pallidus]